MCQAFFQTLKAEQRILAEKIIPVCGLANANYLWSSATDTDAECILASYRLQIYNLAYE